MKGFRTFLLRGNVVDLAVGIVIGAAFTALVNGFVKAFLTPIVGLVSGATGDFSKKSFRASDVTFPYGTFIDATISFVIVAAVIYFLVVLPYTTLRKRGEVEPADDAQVVLLKEIRDLLAQTNGESPGKHGSVSTTPPPEHGPRAEAESK